MKITRHQIRRLIREQLEEEQGRSEEQKLWELFWAGTQDQAILMAETVLGSDHETTRSMSEIWPAAKEFTAHVEAVIDSGQSGGSYLGIPSAMKLSNLTRKESRFPRWLYDAFREATSFQALYLDPQHRYVRFKPGWEKFRDWVGIQ